MILTIPNVLIEIAKRVQSRGAKALVVGGAVRDSLLTIECKDWDIEVYNIDTLDALSQVLSEFGGVNSVGKSFGVLKLKVDNYEFDFSLPRIEEKVGIGHKGFDVLLNSALSYKEAAKRRDFTINAIGYDILEDELIDPYSGREDLERKVLRIVDPDTFVEDPLRVYRAVGFAARFGLRLEDKTLRLCREMVASGMLRELAVERIWEEWRKMLLKSSAPSIGLELMRELGILERYYPELNALVGVAQNSEYHPEGDVWIHTMMSLDKMVEGLKEKSISDEKERLKLLLAILCHDLGKATTTKVTDGRIRSIGHEKAGLEPTKQLLYKLTNEHSFIDSILPLIEHHLKPTQLYLGGAKAAAIKRLAQKVKITELVMVAKADSLGRTTKEALSGEYKAGTWLLERAKELNVSSKAIDNIVTGKELIELGLSPSKEFKIILDDVYNKFIDEQLLTKEDAIEYIKEKYLA